MMLQNCGSFHLDLLINQHKLSFIKFSFSIHHNLPFTNRILINSFETATKSLMKWGHLSTSPGTSPAVRGVLVDLPVRIQNRGRGDLSKVSTAEHSIRF